MAEIVSKNEKRERKKNFTIDETRVLREEFQNNKDVLESKQTNTVTNCRKNTIWKDITAKINSIGIEHRTVEEVKGKWRNICSTAKITWHEYKRQRAKTGGGKAPKSPSEEIQKVIEIYQGQPRFDGLSGFSSFNLPSDTDHQVVPSFSQNQLLLTPTISSVENAMSPVEHQSNSSDLFAVDHILSPVITLPKTISCTNDPTNSKSGKRQKRKLSNKEGEMSAKEVSGDVQKMQVEVLKREKSFSAGK